MADGEVKQPFEGSRMPRSRVILVFPIPLILMIALGCNRGSSGAQMPERPSPVVTATDVVVRDVPFYIDEIGRCAANHSVSVMPQVAGRIDAGEWLADHPQ